MKLILVKDSWEAKGRVFYVIRYIVVDSKNQIVKTGEPLVWLTQEMFDKITI